MSHKIESRVGVLLVNLGTPAAPTPSAIRSWLREFLSDPRVVELPRALWLPLLYGTILPLRPHRLAKKYALIWSEDGSPLLAIARRQTAALKSELSARLGAQVPVALAMRYGEPSIEQALAQLESEAVRRLLLLPLYPQYSGSTTGSVLDAVFDHLRRRRWLPELRTVHQYHDEPAYIAALAESLRLHWQKEGRGDHLLISFHGLPQRYVDVGDPYYDQCQKTAHLFAQSLELRQGSWSVSFQSRLGRAPWIKPYTDVEVPRLAQAGVRILDVICPGFSADCLETLEEVALRYAAQFRAAGGTELRYVPALNDSLAHIAALAGLIESQLRGWL